VSSDFRFFPWQTRCSGNRRALHCASRAVVHVDTETLEMKALLNRFVREESGQDLIEYALLAALIAVACTVAMGSVATAIIAEFAKVVAKLA
jgi:pilus assembly protein Flp/PilA